MRRSLTAQVPQEIHTTSPPSSPLDFVWLIDQGHDVLIGPCRSMLEPLLRLPALISADILCGTESKSLPTAGPGWRLRREATSEVGCVEPSPAFVKIVDV